MFTIRFSHATVLIGIKGMLVISNDKISIIIKIYKKKKKQYELHFVLSEWIKKTKYPCKLDLIFEKHQMNISIFLAYRK